MTQAKNRIWLKTSAMCSAIFIGALFYVKFHKSQLDQSPSSQERVEAITPTPASLVIDSTTMESVEAANDSVNFHYLNENNYVNILGNDELPVITFPLPDGEVTQEVTNENSLVRYYEINGSRRRFEFRMLPGYCKFTGDQHYKDWSTETINSIEFTVGLGSEMDRELNQSKLYGFAYQGYCFTFSLRFPDEEDETDEEAMPVNPAEVKKFMEHVVGSIQIH